MNKTRIILIVSIILNIFLIGAISGGAFWLSHGNRMIMAGSLRIAGSELPIAERRAFRANLRSARHSMADRVKEAHDARAEAANLLRQSNVDQAALTATLEKVRNAEFAVRAAIEQRALQFAATLPQADRELLADAMDRRSKRRLESAQ